MVNWSDSQTGFSAILFGPCRADRAQRKSFSKRYGDMPRRARLSVHRAEGRNRAHRGTVKLPGTTGTALSRDLIVLIRLAVCDVCVAIEDMAVDANVNCEFDGPHYSVKTRGARSALNPRLLP